VNGTRLAWTFNKTKKIFELQSTAISNKKKYLSKISFWV
jgi:hypothetical protein